MTRSLPIVLGLVAAGVIGALAATYSTPAPESATASADALKRLAADVSELTDRLNRTESELRILKTAPPMAMPAPMPESAPEILPEGEEASAAPAAVRGEEFEARVREVVAESREKEREAIGNRFMAMAKERQNRMLDDLAENHGLSPYQREQLDGILTRRQEAVSGFFRGMFGGDEQPDMTQIRAKLSEVQAATDEELQALLDPGQYEAFKEQDQMSRRGGGWMMGGGDRPGGGGRGR